MTKLLRFSFLLTVIFFSSSSFAQTIFYTETFDATACPATSGCDPSLSSWTVTSLGGEGANPNKFYVSCTENGNAAGACGSACGTDQSLHVGNISTSSAAALFCPTGDCGAAYDDTGAGEITNTRAESPTINCTGQSNITIRFNYIEGGELSDDDAQLFYFDGVTWTSINALAKTATTCGASQGLWTAFSMTLPASANNNPSVKIGFVWKNDGDGNATDPSFAVDDITLEVPSVAANPVVTITPVGATTICAGGTVTLNGSATNGPITSWAWLSNPTTGVSFNTSSSQNTIATFTTAGTYTVTLQANNATGSGTTTQAIIVNASPTVNATATPNPVCAGSSTTLTATGATTYQWVGGPGTANYTVTPTGTTTYTVVGLTAGCPDSATVVVTTTSAPTVSISPANPTVCSGSSVILTASGATSYQWTGGPATAAYSVSPTATTTYTVIGTTGGCPSLPATVTVNVSASISASITSSATTICAGQPVTLSASGGATYTWSASTGPTPPATATINMNPTTTTIYTVSVSSGSCTPASASFTVTVTPAPTVTATASTANVCLGSSTTLTASGATSYQWLGGGPNSATYTISPTAATTYTVIGATSGCPDTATVSVTVSPLTPVTASASSTNICSGQSTTLTASPSGAGYSYSWAPSGSITGSSTSATATANPTTTQTFTVTVTGPCLSNPTATVSVTVGNCGPPIAGFYSSDTLICSNSCITYVDTSSGNPTSLLWTFDGGIPGTSTDTMPTVCYPVSGFYNTTLTVTNALGSNTVTMTNYVDVVLSPLAFAGNDTTIDLGTSVTLTGGGAGGGGSYTWTPSAGLSCTTCASPVATPTVTTTYYLSVVNSFGCQDIDTVVVTIENKCYDAYVPTAFSPDGNGINDVLHVKGVCLGVFNFSIYDRWGERVFNTSDKNLGWDGTFRGKAMDAAIFMYTLEGVSSKGEFYKMKGNITLVR